MAGIASSIKTLSQRLNFLESKSMSLGVPNKYQKQEMVALRAGIAALSMIRDASLAKEFHQYEARLTQAVDFARSLNAQQATPLTDDDLP